MRTIDETEAQQAAPRHDTELTLGSGTLLLMFFGLVLLCGLCFGVGYSMGHRGIQDGSDAANFAAGASAFFHGKSASAKPASSTPVAPVSAPTLIAQPATEAITTPVSAQAATPDPSSTAPSTAGPQNEATPTQTPVAAVPKAASAPQPASNSALAKPDSAKADLVKADLVKSALPKPAPPANAKQNAPANSKPSASANAKPQAAAPAKPETPSGPVMVQIAAVSEDEDAEVLVGALRKRNYAVVSGRDPLDGLIHVRIGPFKTRDEADTWREKLLNDGYNAIIQP